MNLQEQITLITPGETLTNADRQEAERQQAQVTRLLALIEGKEGYRAAWADAQKVMGWDRRPLWWQLDALTRWLPLHVIQRLPGDTEAVLLDEAGTVYCKWLGGREETSAVRLQARGARAADRGTRLLRRLVRGGACAGQAGE